MPSPTNIHTLPAWLRPLPQAWPGQRTWRVLDVSGKCDALLQLTPQWAQQASPSLGAEVNPTLDTTTKPTLHYVLALPDAQPLRAQAPPTWQAALTGLLPGVQRLVLEDGTLQLTLWLGDSAGLLRQQTMVADSIVLGHDTQPWLAPHALKPLLRHCQRGTQVLATPSAELTTLLQRNGFRVEDVNPDPANMGLLAVFDPAWTLRKAPAPAAKAGRALVVGAGLAGSSAAWSLAQRGWQVQVLGLDAAPADGASGLPAGLFCPHTSPDDCPLSRLSRAGVQALLARLAHLHPHLQRGHDWQDSGVLEHDSTQPSQLAWNAGPGLDWSQPASATHCQQAGLPADAPALWHRRAGWLRPAALVSAQLRHPNIQFIGHSACAHLRFADAHWQAWGHAGQCLAEGDIAVVAAGAHSPQFLPEHWRLQHLRGQVTWGPCSAEYAPALPPSPVNGSGNLVPRMPGDQVGQEAFWVMGSTFERDVTQLPVSAAEQASAHAHNWAKLVQLLPASAPVLAPAFDPGHPACGPTWARVRLASHDRLPLVGPVAGSEGLYALTALGARGITLAVLCAELLAARLHAEPLPLDAKLAQHLDTQRFQQNHS